jgi:MurNAc alpha-1-phosphate uridylyltransferase
VISDERGALLETAGGLKAARPLLGDQPILVTNIDSVWTESGQGVLDRLIAAWEPQRMDDLLMLVPLENSSGFDGPGDFFRDTGGRLTHRGDAHAAPLAYMGVHMMKPALIDTWPDGPHSILGHWKAMCGPGRLHGVTMDGFWMHVGDPAARETAEARLAAPAQTPVRRTHLTGDNLR